MAERPLTRAETLLGDLMMVRRGSYDQGFNAALGTDIHTHAEVEEYPAYQRVRAALATLEAYREIVQAITTVPDDNPVALHEVQGAARALLGKEKEQDQFHR